MTAVPPPAAVIERKRHGLELSPAEVRAGTTELVRIHPALVAGIEAQAKAVTRGLGANLVWPGLLRKLDRVDPSYRN